MSCAAAQVLLMEELKTFIIKIDQEKQKVNQIYFTFGLTQLQGKLKNIDLHHQFGMWLRCRRLYCKMLEVARSTGEMAVFAG